MERWLEEQFLHLGAREEPVWYKLESILIPLEALGRLKLILPA